MKRWLGLARPAWYSLLFAGLVVLLLWFQGILWRHQPAVHAVPKPPAVQPGDVTLLVERRTLPKTLVFSGHLAAIDRAELAPQVMALVARIVPREGEAVAKDQVLVELDAADARARLAQRESGVLAARAEAERSELAFARAERLSAAGAITTQDWEAARAARDAAVALHAQAEAARQEAAEMLARYRLLAPFAGVVLARHTEPGSLALPGRPCLTLYRPTDLRLEVALPTTTAGELGEGDYAIWLDGHGERAARLDRVLPAADPATGTVLARFLPADPQSLRAGLYGRLTLQVGEREVLLLAARAVQRIGQVERVQRVLDGSWSWAVVRTGRRHGDQVEVLSGLAGGERVRLP